MNNTRKRRLLILATKPHNHKRRYSWYYKLMGEGLVGWQLGTAFLTDEGRDWIKRNPR
jgi:hypothetical protein